MSEAELRRIATPMLAAEPFQVAREFDELTDTVKTILNGDTYSDEAKQMLRLQVENQRLAAMLINQKLRQELRQSLDG